MQHRPNDGDVRRGRPDPGLKRMCEVRVMVACAVILCGYCGAGCQNPGTGKWGGIRPSKPVDARHAATSSNIVQIVKFYPREPWVRFRKDIAPAVDGIRTAALFLIDGETGRGMFGDGTIIVDLYEIGTDEDGYEVSTPVYQWSFDTEQAMPFRSNKRTVQGWGYQLRLQWEDLDLAGREIEVRISFRRLDEQVVNSRGQRFRVPAARMRRRRPQVAAVRGGATVHAPRVRRGPGRLRRSTPTARPKGTAAPTTRPAPAPSSQPAFVPRTESER